MSIAALQQYTFVLRYARYQKSARRRETWHEAVERVKTMHLDRYPHVAREIEQAFNLVHQQRVLGSQRALQFGGASGPPNHAYLYNCTASFCDRLRFFQEALWLSLCGCGVGLSVQSHHTARLPRFSTAARRSRPRRTFMVPDSIEGWADALGVLLSSFFESPLFPEYAGHEIDFDYCLLRPAGAVGEAGLGKAAGPQPLITALEAVRSLLLGCLERGAERLRPIDAYDLTMHACAPRWPVACAEPPRFACSRRTTKRCSRPRRETGSTRIHNEPIRIIAACCSGRDGPRRFPANSC